MHNSINLFDKLLTGSVSAGLVGEPLYMRTPIELVYGNPGERRSNSAARLLTQHIEGQSEQKLEIICARWFL